VESRSTSTNSKYWSMDHSDSTAPSAYDTKNLSAAGTSTLYENNILRRPPHHTMHQPTHHQCSSLERRARGSFAWRRQNEETEGERVARVRERAT